MLTPDETRRYFRQCDPDSPLDPSDERFVDIDAYNANDEPVRGQVWVRDLAEDFRNSDKARCELFTGLPGSGKSTVLRQLAAELAKPAAGEPKFFTVNVRAEEWIDPAAPVDVPDLQLAILYETEKQLRIEEGESAEYIADEGIFARLWHWLNTTEVEFRSLEISAVAEANVPAVGKVSGSAKSLMDLRSSPSLRAQIRELAQNRLHTFLVHVWSAHEELWQRAKKLGFAGVVVMVDSLEKLRGIQSNFEDVLISAEKIFSQGAPYLTLSNKERGPDAALVHVLYTVPPALTLRRAMHELRFLPMIKLRSRDGADYELGIRAAIELIERRVPRDALDQLFGADQREARCRAIVKWSGGYPRDIVRVLRQCVKQTEPINEARFRRILSMQSEGYRSALTVDLYPWLAEVSITHDLALRDDNEHRELVDRALSDNLVLRYTNDRDWFDVHPALASEPRFVSARAKFITARDAPEPKP